MTESIEEIPPPSLNPDRKKSRSLKSLLLPKYPKRAPSRQFNDPIYAGLDNLNYEQNKEHSNWGPWIGSGEGTGVGGVRHSQSVHGGLGKMRGVGEELVGAVARRGSIGAGEKGVQGRSPSRSQLPEIKQKGKTNFLEIKLGQIDHKNSIKLLPTPIKPKQKPLQIPRTISYTRKPIDIHYSKNKIKLGTVVYNYCTNYNVDECLLNYGTGSGSGSGSNYGYGYGGDRRRGSEQIDSKLQSRGDGGGRRKLEEEMLLTRYEGLKAYWKKRSSTIVIKGKD